MWTCLLVALLIQLAVAKPGFGPTDQDWGHVTVRENAHIFWWLHYTSANVTKYTDRPLIIWLQGGPGSSSTGYGNFAELGPLDLNLEYRNTTWVQYANILFVDNPVGVGFGYVDGLETLVKNNTQIADDFLVFMKKFYDLLPEFKRVPLYIFCESYGGKMTAEIALTIDQARKRGEIEANLKGIGLGDSWISPVDIVSYYAPYLLNLGQIDQDGYNAVMEIAGMIKTYMDNDKKYIAIQLWDVITGEVEKRTYGVDFYNVLTKIERYDTRKRLRPLRDFDDNGLADIMNNKVRVALNLTQTWISQNDNVYDMLGMDFMNPVTEIVEQLLNETDITVAVYNGQLDLIVNTPGVISWIEKLNFKDKDLWAAAPRQSFSVNGYYEGYVRKYGKFAFYWVDRAGHMVPADNPAAMRYILEDVTNHFSPV